MLYSGIEIKNLNIKAHLNIVHPTEFMHVCAKKGMTTAIINNVDDIRSLAIASFDNGFNFNSKGGILLGFDFGCFKTSGCTGN